MTPLDFPEYAALWQEQISPEELARFQARAKNIERNANRKWLRDIALACLALAMISLFLWFNPTSLRMKLGFVPLVAMTVGFVWRRHQIARASRATTVEDPRIFFKTAIKNLRAEINLSTISLCFGWPVFIATVVLAKTARNIDVVDWFLRLPRDINLAGATILALFCLSFVLFAWEHVRLREQLRRLESMSREWDDEPARDVR